MNGSNLPAVIPLSTARELATAACLRAGANAASAESLVQATLSAARFGPKGMGFPHLMDYLDALRQGRIDGHAEPLIAYPLPTVIRVDARRGIAQLGFDRAFDDLCQRARASGTALFTQRNSYTAGELGYYVRRLADQNFIGLAVANGPPLMAAAAGGLRVYCTNPRAFGAPLGSGHKSLVIDQAASATAFVNIAQAARERRSIPEGWAIGASGQPTTDAESAVQGALLPFGGYKGANIALLVEVLAAGLSAASWSIDAPAFNEGEDSPNSGLTVVALAPLDPDFAPRLSAQLERLSSLGVAVPSQRAAHADPVDDSIESSPALLAQLECRADMRSAAAKSR